jgi:hypothetical protein
MFQNDAADLLNARQKAKNVHQQGNIREAGDEVEILARNILGKRYLGTAHTTHGHIIDANWKVSRQLDFIVCDPRLFPVWNVLQSGAQNILYDSVYAIGEIKSGYYADHGKTPIEKFSETVAELKKEFVRDRTTLSDKLGITATGPITITSSNADPYRNPLFTFMLFVNSDEIDFDAVRQFYKKTVPEHLPNIVCLLDRGCILNFSAITESENPKFITPKYVHPIPEFDIQLIKGAFDPSTAKPLSSHWLLTQPSDQTRGAGANLMTLHGLLFDAMRRIVLKPSDLTTRLLNLTNSQVPHVFT